VRDELISRPLLVALIGLALGCSITFGDWPFCGVLVLLALMRDLRSTLWFLAAFLVGWFLRPPLPSGFFEPVEFGVTVEVCSVPERVGEKYFAMGCVGANRYQLRFDRAGVVRGDTAAVKGVLRPLSESAGYGRGAKGQIVVEEWRAISDGAWWWQIGFMGAESFRATINRSFSPQSATLVRGVCMNQTDGLENDDWQRYRELGIVHLLSASGFHAAVVVGVFLGAFGVIPVDRRIRILLACLATALFAIAAGFEPPIVRALIMTSVLLPAYALMREPDGLSSVGLAGCLSLLFDPAAIVDLGFLLSMACTMALVAVLPSRWREVPRWKLWVYPSLVATAASWPIVGFVFGEVSLLGLLGNIVFVPLVGLIVVLALSGWVISLAVPPVGAVVLGGVDHLVLMTNDCARILSGFPGGVVTLPPYSFWGLGCLIFALVAVWRGGRWRVWILGFCAVGFVADAWSHQLKDQVSFLSVGQGDAVFIVKQGTTLLVDTGTRNRYVDAGLRVVWPELRRRGVRHLDAVILTHYDIDHFGGFESIANRILVHRVFVGGRLKELDFKRYIAESGVNPKLMEVLDRSETLRIGDLEMLVRPGGEVDDNDSSPFLTLEFGNERVVLTGDASVSQESMWSDQEVKTAFILKAGHHGSRTSSSAEWLKKMSPKFFVVSCGRNNVIGHPDPEVLSRVEALGATVLRTDRDGSVTFAWRDDRLVLAREEFFPNVKFFQR
jgi:competence protein ComEC